MHPARTCANDPPPAVTLNANPCAFIGTGVCEAYLTLPPGPCTLLIRVSDENMGEGFYVHEQDFVVSPVGDTEVHITVDCKPVTMPLSAVICLATRGRTRCRQSCSSRGGSLLGRRCWREGQNRRGWLVHPHVLTCFRSVAPERSDERRRNAGGRQPDGPPLIVLARHSLAQITRVAPHARRECARIASIDA
jgi:hypothetical protein